MCGSLMAIYTHLSNEKKMRNAVYWFAYVLKFDRAGIWKCVALSNFVKILINGYEGCLSFFGALPKKGEYLSKIWRLER